MEIDMELLSDEEQKEIEKKEVMQEIIIETLEEVEKNNGTGKPSNENDRQYHNLNHTHFVMLEANNLLNEAIKNGNALESDRLYVGIAGAGHDERQDLGRGLNEIESARLMRERMSWRGVFTEAELQKVESMILATTTYFDKENVMHQSALEDNFLAKLLADADLANLGKKTEEYFAVSRKFMTELKGKEPSIETQIAFWESNINLLTYHEYYTDEAKAMFSNQTANLEATQREIDKLRSSLGN